MKKTNKNKKQTKIKLHTKQQLTWIFWTTLIMIFGLILFKYLLMYIYGKDILFDASSHVTFTILGLYILWFFVDQKKAWRIPYFIFAGALLIIMSVQRIFAQEHNEIGVALAILISGIAIVIPRWNEFKGGIKF
jgi:O-antigen/teichoic acid export membrane protein